MDMSGQMTIEQIKAKKKRGDKIVVLTAYDYPLASLIDKAGADMILVGDSLANVVLGLSSTTQIGMTEMLHHAKAVRRAVQRALVVGDMPFESYQTNPQEAAANAKRFIEEAGCGAVKLEWFDRCLDAARGIIRAGIPLMGHVGLTPQTAESSGGFKVQGKDAASAQEIIRRAKALEAEGCFSVVLECIPAPVAEMITRELAIPTIGIGAGPACDGQVLVTHDLLGLSGAFRPKFVKQYVHLDDVISQAVARFCAEVRDGKFPDESHSYSIARETLKQLRERL